MRKIGHAGNLIIAGFVIAALALLFLVYKSTQVKFDMAVEGDYYQKEMAFNEQLKAQKLSNAFGDDFKLTQEQNKLLLSVPQQLSQQMENGVVTFYCLSDSKNDVAKSIQANNDGRYLFDKAEVTKGHNYIVKVAFHANGHQYYKEFPIQ